MEMKTEIGLCNNRDSNYLCRPSMHMDCFCWEECNSYLPVGSQGLMAVAKANLRYDPVAMRRMAMEQPEATS
jgi:DNA polymerase epsilon subunit 1